MKLTGGRLQTDKDDGGVGVWVSEIAWRDFYQGVSPIQLFLCLLFSRADWRRIGLVGLGRVAPSLYGETFQPQV